MTKQPADSNWSSKLLIVSMLLLALLMAGFSWWFRFASTHRAARFWGPEAARLVRDAEQVEAYSWNEAGETTALGQPADMRQVALAPGMTHLRAALLEDRSFSWDEANPIDAGQQRYGLRFVGENPADEVWVCFSEQCQWLWTPADQTSISCAPIAPGLRTVMEELFEQSE